ncbi:transcription factor GTE12-like isoform X1 [Pyrus communis]|uniref:transcription factor GTE12-like isoform X1 n=1 Tax=Pyrus communis TaxID=23211 RepID=UPI0035C1AC67
MIATKTMLSSNKLKIKFACKRIEADPGKKLEADTNYSRSHSHDYGHQASIREVSAMAKSSLPGSKKRGSSGDLEGQKEKKRKIDRSVKVQCLTILKTLMSKKESWPFNEPVDPVKLRIPDYFRIISHPMDLGTVKSKLQKDLYFSAEEFAADVRLTFSNAMLYNPPGNPFHHLAENLNSFFEMRWGLLDEKLSHGSSKVESGNPSSGQIKKVTCARQNPGNSPPLQNSLVSKRPISGEEKVRVPVGATDAEAELSKTAQNSNPKLSQNLNRSTDSACKQASGSINAKQPSCLVCLTCGSCGNIACQCRRPSDSTHKSFNDKSSERSMGREHGLSHSNVPRLDCQTKSLSTSQTSKSDPESDGALSALDGENICSSSQLTTPVLDAASGEGWSTSLFDVELSPKRALRAAMLKSRFADTIWKAQQQKLLDHGDRSDPLKMQQERARLERKHREEKARIEAEIRAAEAATRMRAENELKQQRERKREEARMAVEKMRQTVEIETSLKILEELGRFTGFSVSAPILNFNRGSGAFGGSHPQSPLEQLGLFLKPEYSGDDDDEEEEDESTLYGDGEEGEIV